MGRIQKYEIQDRGGFFQKGKRESSRRSFAFSSLPGSCPFSISEGSVQTFQGIPETRFTL